MIEREAVTSEKRFPLWKAVQVAAQLVPLLGPYCQRIEVCGSVRRLKPEVKDIELLCVSAVGQSLDMFGATNYWALDMALDQMVKDGDLLVKRKNKSGQYNYGEKNKLLVHVPTGIGVDVFSTTEANWGMSKVVRTGPAEFNIRMMRRFPELRLRGHAYGGVTRLGPPGREEEDAVEIACPTELAVFDLLGWPYLNPVDRH